MLFDNDKLKKYHLNRNDILLSSNSNLEVDPFGGTALDIFPNSLFNKKVNLSDKSFVGFVMGMTDTKIIILGDYETRYDIPKTKTAEVNDNIVLNMTWSEFVSYRNDSTQY